MREGIVKQLPTLHIMYTLYTERVHVRGQKEVRLIMECQLQIC